MTPITDFETFSPEIYLLSRNVASPLSDLRSPAANLKARFSKSPPAPPHKIQSDLKSNERFSKSLSFLREPTLRYCKALVVLFRTLRASRIPDQFSVSANHSLFSGNQPFRYEKGFFVHLGHCDCYYYYFES